MDMQRPEIYHYVFELFGVHTSLLEDVSHLRNFAQNLTRAADLPVVSEHQHFFEPIGITLVLVLASSHLSIHTWPENNYLHLDLLTCKSLPENFNIREICSDFFGPVQIDELEIKYAE